MAPIDASHEGVFAGRFIDPDQPDDGIFRYGSEVVGRRRGPHFKNENAMLAFALTCLLIELTPGPNMAYLAILSASKGRRAGYIATLGVAAGLLILGICAALGLTAFISTSHALYQILRWGGFIYLLWLAWDAWRDESLSSDATSTEMSQYWLRGLVTNLLNPKAGLFYVTVMPAFMDETKPLAIDAVTLCIVYVGVATTVHASIVTLADSARPWLDDANRRRKIRRIFAVLLAGIALWLIATT